MRKTLLLFIVLLLGLQGWATTFTVDGVTYTITDATNKTVAIGTGVNQQSAISTSTAGTFTIPSAVNYNGDNYAVTSVGSYAFYGCSKITSVTIPSSVASLGLDAFGYCFELTSIFIPTSVTSIGEYAFEYSKLTSIIIPSSVISIGSNAFWYCGSLTSLTVDSSNSNYSSTDGVLFNKDKTTLIQYPLGNAQTSYIIPSSATSIGGSAFEGCPNLTSITIPSSVNSIENLAFIRCQKLTSITVDGNNSNYTSVDGVLFNKNETTLIQYPIGNTQTSYAIPASVVSVSSCAFEDCLKLTSISIPGTITSIGSTAFTNCNRLTAIYVNNINPANISLGGLLFLAIPTSTCTLYVPTGSKLLYTAADQWKTYPIVEQDNTFAIFANSSPTIGGTIIGSSAYTSGSLCTLTATPVAGYIFSGWTEGGTVVSTDASYTFTVNTSRTLVANFYSIISASANPAGYGSVSGGGNYMTGSSCTLTATPASGYVFSKWTEKGSTVSTNSSYTFTVSSARTLVANFVNTYRLSLSVNSDQGGVVTGGGTYGNGTSQTITATPNDGYGFKSWVNNKGTVLSTSKSYTLTLTKDSTLTANFVKTYDFTDTNGLYYKISSPTTAYVTYRNSNGGDYSGTITIPSTVTINNTSYTVTAIGDSAFYNCSGLRSISIANSITAIGRYSFYCCNKLTSINLPNSVISIGIDAFASCVLLTAITIPNSVTTIGINSFNCCFGLTEVSIPASVVSIGVYAFANCPGLTSITVENNNPNYCSVNGVLFNKNKTNLIQYPAANTQTSYSIPNTVITVGGSAFDNDLKLASILIPPSVTSINSLAFYNCTGLRSIYANNIDPGKITLGSWVFDDIPTSTCALYVPTGSKALYAAANQWKDFTNIIEAILTPTISIIPSQSTICPGSAVTFASTTTDGGDSPVYQWKLNGAAISGATNSSYTTTSLNNNDIITCDITGSLSCLVSNSSTSNSIKMTVNPIVTPSVSVSSSATEIYPGGSVTFTATPTNGGTAPAYQWYLNGAAISGETKSTFTSATLSNYDEVSCLLTGNMSCATTPTATSNTITMKVSNFFTTGGICYFITSSSYPYTASVADDGSASYSGNVTIPSSVTYCGNRFKITSIGTYAFMASKDLVSVTIPSTVTTIGYSAFRDCDKLNSIIVDAANLNYYSINGVLFNKTATNLILCPNGRSDSYIIPSSVTNIADSAFVNCDKLTSIILPSSVTSIGNYAFMACSGIKSITLLPSIKSIGDDAFTNCTGLSSIHVNNAFPSAITLGVSLFYGVSGSDCTVYVPMGSKSLYEDIYPWNKFNIVEETDLFAVYATASSAVGEVTGSGTYTSGSLCALKAIPSTGYAFTTWTENGTIVSTNANYSFTVSGTHTFVANFTANSYAVTTSPNISIGGTVTSSCTYTYGSSCTLTATPAAGYTFTNWTENGTVVSTSANYTFTVNAARAIVANFVRGYSITVSANSTEGGTVTGGGTFLSGTRQTIMANANPYYGFKNWTDKKGNVISTSSPFTFTLSKDTTLTANFVKKYDFTDTNGLYYKISSPTTAYVTYRNSAGGDYSGNTTIPSTATINGTSYNVTAIGDSAFYNCSGLTSISIANSVTSIGRYSFSNCSSLPSITLSDVITSIGTYAFASCYNLRSVTLPNSLTTLSDGLFIGCSKLTAITIPNSVSVIGENTFSSCSGLTSATISASVVSLGIDAFEYCTGLTSITVENNNPNYCSVDGVLFNKNKTTLIQYPLGNSQTSYSVPNTVTTIGQDAFEKCLKLTTITIPSSVTSINSWAFYNCTGLTSIYATNIDPGKITLGGWIFNYIPSATCTLYVPTGSKSLYAAASQWKDFMNIVEVPLYTITASVNISTGGNVNGAGSYLSSNQCTISAVPNTGYSFANWTENGTVVSTDASYIFTVTANRTLVANFTENNAGDYTITMSSSPSVGGSTTGTGRYASGATCIASATANTGYIFSNWTENGMIVSKHATDTFKVSTARTLVANFIAGYTVTAVSNSSTGGSVTGAGGYVTGASCTLTASIDTGCIFSNWTENGTVASTNATYTFTVNAAHTFVANFVAGFIINATADASQGNIIGTGGYATGTSCTLQATPKNGYVFTGWSENGTVVSTNPSYVFTISTARFLVANFSTVGVTVTQPTATTLSGSIVVTPSTGFTYSLDGKTYQSSNEFPYVSIGTYNVTLKNSFDGTVSSPVLAVVSASGVVAANNYQIKASNCTCRDTKDGAIAVTLAKALDYTVTVTGTNTGYKQSVMFSGTSYNLKNLPADTYKLVFKIDFLDNYEQSFNVVVTQPDDLSVLKVGAEKSRATYALSGGTNYYVSVNDNTTETQGDQVQVSLVPGENKIKIYTEKLCQGMYEETIYNSENGQISLFPNPTTGKITIGIPGEEESVTAEIISLSGAVQLEQKLIVPPSRLVDLNVSDFSSGTYIVKVNGSTVHSSVKMVKK